jgi:hypothetical protein
MVIDQQREVLWRRGGLEGEEELQEKEPADGLVSLSLSLWLAWLFEDHVSSEPAVCGIPDMLTAKDWPPCHRLTRDLTKRDNRGRFSSLCVCTKSGTSDVNQKELWLAYDLEVIADSGCLPVLAASGVEIHWHLVVDAIETGNANWLLSCK